VKTIVAVIPARYDSVRFPGKPLEKILGVPMIERVYNKVRSFGKFSKIVVATDDKRIFDNVRSFGGEVVMPSGECRSGTDRVWEVVKELNNDAVVNIQGDEPLISEKLLSEIYNKLAEDDTHVVTAAFFNESFKDFQSENVVKTLFSKNGKALYFSRAPVPHCTSEDFLGFYHHVGIYGYNNVDLEKFVNLEESNMEKLERLEQLRFLENGINITVIKTDYRSLGVDTPEDIIKIENILKGSSN
jgi:3-deoxy-manno-octulosonate cytidylyltransferase (CMP-KDO synthetase)